MSLRRTVAAPFIAAGRERRVESEFVVALSLDRDWFSPEDAKQLLDCAVDEGLLRREDDEVVATFDPASVSVPEGFTPDDSVLRDRSSFERVLDAVVEAGVDKQTAVAEINRLQQDLGVTVEAAAVVYAHRQAVMVPGVLTGGPGEGDG
jgi:hypothetical protein